MTPRCNSSLLNCAMQLYAPRSLKLPIGCSLSAFTKSEKGSSPAPAAFSRAASTSYSPVRTATPAILSRAERMSSSVTSSAMCNEYSGAGIAPAFIREFTNMMAKLPNRMQYAGLGVLAAVFFLSPGTESRSQARTAAPPDIYANFVGVWVGTDHYLKDGAEVTKPLRLTIEETKKKDAMRFMYEYGTKGQKDYSQPRRRITLNPSRAEMTSEWDDSAKDHWKALGL